MKSKSIQVLLDPELVARFESAEAINAALRILVDAAHLVKPAKVKARARRTSRPKTTTGSVVNVPDADHVAALDAVTSAPSPNPRLRRAVRRARSHVAR